MAKLIEYGFTVISLALVVAPFFIIKKKFKPILWRHIFLGYLMSFIIVIFSELAYRLIDRAIKDIDYSQALLLGSNNFYLWFSFFIIISPFLITKIKYKTFNLKRFFISLLLSIFLAIGSIVFWAYFIAWGLGQIGAKYL